jgi:pSer/pThr/pTyr-binding forkhead associated (FHA) protein
VSCQHAILDRCVRGWLLMDSGSANGTRLNGWRVREPVPVHPGDQVTFGAVTFVLREGGSRVGRAGDALPSPGNVRPLRASPI